MDARRRRGYGTDGGAWRAGDGRDGFQLWIALPPELELGPSESVYLAPEVISQHGPVRVLLGSYGTATSAIKTTFTDELPRGAFESRIERWTTYQPAADHTVLWTSVGGGSVLVPDELHQGELVAFRRSIRRDRIRGPIRCGVRTWLGYPA